VSEQGLRVPEDVSVVGFDDAPIATQGTPALTTVRQPYAAKGRLAGQALMSALAQDNAPSHIVLDTELVVRQSTAKAAPNTSREPPPTQSRRDKPRAGRSHRPTDRTH
jgi:DNA-binding LacI/PurR family transcriptional regulator